MKADLEGVFTHEDDPVVIFVITAGWKVQKVLIDQGSSTDVMFWELYQFADISRSVRPYDGCMVGFAGD